VHEPKLLLLDEPTTGVDPVSRREFWKLLSEFLSVGLTIVMATPYLDEAERCSRVALLHAGRLLAADTPAALRKGLGGDVIEVITRTPRPPIELLASLEGVRDVQAFGERAHVRTSASNAAAGQVDTIRAALESRGIDVLAVRPITASLEDVFIDLIAPRPGHERSGPQEGERPHA
jgi:ABC-2 type transport system ATP-binding protein